MIEEAIKLAKRSTIRTHKTGALIVYRGDIVATGWSHVPPQRDVLSVHAEMHAIARGRHLDIGYAKCYIATVVGSSGNTTLARPCLHCAIALRAFGVWEVFYTTPAGGVGSIVLEHELDRYNLKIYKGLHEPNGD